MENRMLSCSSLTGMDVRNTRGEDLGRIKDIMVDLQSGRIQYLVVSFGGFLGIGDKYFAVPLEAITMDPVDEIAVLDVDKERLEHAPGFDKDHWPQTAQPEFLSSMYNFYGLSQSDEEVVNRRSTTFRTGDSDISDSSTDRTDRFGSGPSTRRAGEDSLVGGHDITWNKASDKDSDSDLGRSDDSSWGESSRGGIINTGRDTLGNMMNTEEGDIRDLGKGNIHGHVEGGDVTSRDEIRGMQKAREDMADGSSDRNHLYGSSEETPDKGTFRASTGYPESDVDDKNSLWEKGKQGLRNVGDHIRGDHDHDGIKDKHEGGSMENNRDLDRERDFERDRNRDRNRIEGSLDSTRNQDRDENNSLWDRAKDKADKLGDHIRGDHDHDGVRDKDELRSGEVRSSLDSDRDNIRDNDESLWEKGKRAMRNLGDKLSGDDDARMRNRENYEHRSRGNFNSAWESSAEQRQRSSQGSGSGDSLERNSGNDQPRPNVTGNDMSNRSPMESGQTWRGSDVTGSTGSGSADPSALGNDYGSRDEFPGTDQRSGVEGRSMPANDAEEYGREHRLRDDLRDTNRDTMSNPPSGAMGTGRSDIRNEGNDSLNDQRLRERRKLDDERRDSSREQRRSDDMDDDLRDDPAI